MGAVTVDRIQASGIFKAFSALGGLISLIGSGMTILLGWGETVKLLKAFLAGS